MNEDLSTIWSLMEKLSVTDRDTFLASLQASSDFEKITTAIDRLSPAQEVCPHCHSNHFVKFGRRTGIQRYRCKECGKTFNSLTGNELAKLHKKELWLKMAYALAHQMTVEETAAFCGVATTTAFRWRHRFIKAFGKHTDSTLREIVELDETYVLKAYKGIKQTTRPPRKRGSSRRGKGGLSNEYAPVLAAVDRNGHVIASVLHDHKAQSVQEAMKGKVADGAVLCIDGGSAVFGYADKSGNAYRVTSPDTYVYEPEPIFHIQTVNAYHSQFKTWLKPFRGVNADYLQNYADWNRCCRTNLKDTPPQGWLNNCIL